MMCLANTHKELAEHQSPSHAQTKASLAITPPPTQFANHPQLNLLDLRHDHLHGGLLLERGMDS